ncbi:hypothetical protein IQ235_17720 [Oscillatoriales cyanobacterium LEGE 11467]|uniref:Uncharacterized protein n=1 Tax=Zarconia navalis LEGE 11467 TaxID=1828826 RepID=A0A928VYG3_9CYAN|nr:hypothetical protein [Zarconia navalis]MBE9042604.1 hypothetical protein [Zarconia navalis LEGE 11467]
MNWQLWLPAWVAGVGLAAVTVLSLGYVLTRPCTIGPCKPITRAQQLSQNSLEKLDTERSTAAFIAANQQLAEAGELLEDIPRWSTHYGTAKELQAFYQEQRQMLLEASGALNRGNLAARKSQNPPHSTEQWQEIQELWEGAIEELEQVPQNSPAFEFAQQKLSEYRSNLAAIEQRKTVEETASEKLETALTAAEIAQARQSVAQNLEEWQLTYASWQTAIAALRRVPQGTLAEERAEELFADYEPQFVTARERRTQEQIATNFYNEAIRLADRAKTLQEQRKWNQAVSHWQQGIGAAGQVPEGSSLYPQAQILVQSYAQILQGTTAIRRQVQALDRARAELKDLCVGPIVICEYTSSREKIKVFVLPLYIEYIRNLTRNSNAQGDIDTRTRIEEHKRILIDGLTAISNRSKIPMELYQKSDGSLIGSHQPTP